MHAICKFFFQIYIYFLRIQNNYHLCSLYPSHIKRKLIRNFLYTSVWTLNSLSYFNEIFISDIILILEQTFSPNYLFEESKYLCQSHHTLKLIYKPSVMYLTTRMHNLVHVYNFTLPQL